MSDYTPGPWFVHDLRGVGGPISISCTTPDHITVADIGPGIENTEAEALANARLIAAAPDLLAERDRLREALNDIAYGFGRLAYSEDAAKMVEIARTVLQEGRDE